MSWKELETLPFVGRERGSDIRETCEHWLKAKNIKLTPKLELNNTEAIKMSVHCGIGFSLLPWCTVQQEVENGSLRVISAPYLDVVQNFYVSHYSGKMLSKAEKTFLEFMFKEIEYVSAGK